MITVCLWKWGDRYGVEHLEKMQSMLKRHLSLPHEIVCITDNRYTVPAGMHYFSVRETIKRKEFEFNCVRRMWLYSAEAKKLGKRLLQLDLDMVLTDSIDPIVDRPEPFVIWRSDSTKKPGRPHGWAWNATVMLSDAGARDDVWQAWSRSPKKVARQADAAGWDYKCNSDQAIGTYLLLKGQVAEWTAADGIHAYRVFAGPDGMKDKGLPEGCRMVSFHGRRGIRNPANKTLQERSPWIREHWC